jgi:hypothetical protein
MVKMEWGRSTRVLPHRLRFSGRQRKWCKREKCFHYKKKKHQVTTSFVFVVCVVAVWLRFFAVSGICSVFSRAARRPIVC